CSTLSHINLHIATQLSCSFSPCSASRPFLFSFFTPTPTTEVYTLSLHDALPIWLPCRLHRRTGGRFSCESCRRDRAWACPIWSADRKSTRLNSSHRTISYAVFCLKKKKNNNVYTFGTDRRKSLLRCGGS